MIIFYYFMNMYYTETYGGVCNLAINASWTDY